MHDRLLEIRDLRNRAQRYAQAVYGLLPETLVPHARLERFSSAPQRLREHIEKQASLDEWKGVIDSIGSLADRSNFSPELIRKLPQALEAVELHDVAVAKELMAQTPDEDKKVVGECIRAISYGRFIKHDGQLEGITGLKREVWMRVADAWPNVADVKFAANVGGYALNNILGYPHRRQHDWSDYISVPYERVEEISKNWRKLRKQISDF